MNLCLIDLAELTGGRLQLAAMPPLDGVLARVGRIVLSPGAVDHGVIYWQLIASPGDIETAFLRGALGVVASGRLPQPWPGRFCLQVDDPLAALRLLVGHLDAVEELFSKSSPELKVLQLCGSDPSCIPPPTCGRSADRERPRRCRRQAA
jgi:hypothetical protein